MRKRAGTTKEFYPDYLSEILVVIVLTMGLVFALALLFEPVIGREINFISAYQPKPEWYFLWLYQLVMYFPGQWAVVGAVLIPVLAVALLIYIPCLDRGTTFSRNVAVFCFAFLLLGISILTIIPVLNP